MTPQATTAEAIADSLLSALNDVWKRFSERASTRVNDVCATMAREGASAELVAEYRKTFADAYTKRLDAFDRPSTNGAVLSCSRLRMS
jgi:hypothetical protein